MSESESELVSGGEPGAASGDETPQATPEPEDRTHANRTAKVLPLSPAWIKAKMSGGDILTTIGYDFRKMKSHTDVVLFTIPNGARLDDLHGKAVMLPSQAGARASIEGYRYETVRGPDESQKDLHLLCMADGVALNKPVSAMYSLQIPLADVPADEEPVDDSILDAIQEALPSRGQDGIAGLHNSKKQRKSKHGRLSRLTGDAQEHDGPQVREEDTAVAAAPPDTDANVESAERVGSKRSKKEGRGHSAVHTGAANGEDAAAAGEADAREPSDSKKKRKKKKNKQKRVTEGMEDAGEAPDMPDEAAHEEPVEGAAGGDDEMATAEDTAEDAPEMEAAEADVSEDGTGVVAPDADTGEADGGAGEAAEEQDRRNALGKKRKRSKSVGAVLQPNETDKATDSTKKKKKKRALSMGDVDALTSASPLAKKKKKKKKSQQPSEAD